MNFAFFLEEPSAREMLKGLLPKVLPSEVAVQYVVFQGKHDLNKSLVRKLQAWQRPDTAFFILQDQDAADCGALKQELMAKCEAAGKSSAVVRIACRELESWYFGDLRAVEEGLDLENLRRRANQAKYRVPDSIHSPSRELRMITGGAYQKVGGSRAIGPRMSINENASHSFGVFMAAIRRFADA